MKTYRAIKATIVVATIKALKQMYAEHYKAELKLIKATRKGTITTDMWDEHDLLERAIVRAEATLPQRVVERVKAGEL